MYLKNSSPVHPGIPQSLKSSFTPRIHRVPLVPLDPPKNLFGVSDFIIFVVNDCRMRLSVLSTSQLNLTIVDGWTRLIRDVPICWRAHYLQTSNLLFSIQVLEKIERLYTPTGVLCRLNLVIEIASLNDEDRHIRNFGQASCEEYQNCSSIQKRKRKRNGSPATTHPAVPPLMKGLAQDIPRHVFVSKAYPQTT